MRREGGAEAVVVGKTHHQRDVVLRRRIRRQLLCLLICQRLDAVLGVPQEAVSQAQAQRFGLIDVAETLERLEHRQQLRLLQLRLAPAPDHLQHLHAELDVADAAGAELHVIRIVPFLDDARLHLAQRLDGAEVEVTPVGERLQPPQHLFARKQVARAGAGFDERVALPVAALGFEVGLERIEVHHQRPAVAVRPEAQVDAKNKAVHGGRVQRVDQHLRRAHEVLLVGLAAVRLTGLRVGEDEVHIRRQVQLARTQLAERKHHQALTRTVLRAHRHAEPAFLIELRLDPAHRDVDKQISHGRHRGDGFLTSRQTGGMAHHDVQLQTHAGDAKYPFQGVHVGGCGDLGAQRFAPCIDVRR